MGQMRGDLVKATRGLDALLKPLEALQPLRDALGEALDVERLLDEQRAELARVENDIAAKLVTAKDMDRMSGKAKADALADVDRVKAGADAALANARTSANAMLADAKARADEAALVLMEAKAEATKIVSDAIQSIADKKAELAALSAALKEEQALVAQVKTEKARLAKELA